ncbi:hypothetical protein L596_020657 [Steinernema carpocapsae]|uniref:Uncharacterized protein n=1 Tax=Steinernema carpocapsae TaxID=34508 RepID=A0A4U5MUE0_STECR|nr:hypothetical protein L596_020657 [Steinernema carpocapsae]
MYINNMLAINLLFTIYTFLLILLYFKTRNVYNEKMTRLQIRYILLKAVIIRFLTFVTQSIFTAVFYTAGWNCWSTNHLTESAGGLIY